MKIKNGFSLVEMGIVLAAYGSFAITQMNDSNMEHLEDTARSIGVEIGGYNSAVSRYLSVHADDPDDATGIFVGSDWLKSIDCGGDSNKAILDCKSMPGGKTIHGTLRPTTVVNSDLDGSMSAITTWEPILTQSGEPDSFSMGVAALVASGTHISQLSDVASSYSGPTAFCPSFISYADSIGPFCDGHANRIVSRANTNSSVEEWLRVDHGNTMQHVIEFDDGSNTPTKASGSGKSLDDIDGKNWRQIVNVSRIYNLGSSGNDSIILGKHSGESIYSDSFITANDLLHNSVVVDGNAAIMEDLYTKGNAIIKGSIVADKNISAKGNISSEGNISAKGKIYARGRITSDLSVTAGHDVRAYHDVIAQEDLEVGGDSRVDGSMEIGKSLSATGNIIGEENISAKKNITAGWRVEAPIYFDSDNGYQVDPSNNTILTNLTTNGRLRVNEFLQLNRKVKEDDSCSPNGILARLADGAVVSCTSGKWVQPGISSLNDLYRHAAGQTKVCASGGARILADGTPQYKATGGWKTGVSYGNPPAGDGTGRYIRVNPQGYIIYRGWVTYKQGGHSDGAKQFHESSCQGAWK